MIQLVSASIHKLVAISTSLFMILLLAGLSGCGRLESSGGDPLFMVPTPYSTAPASQANESVYPAPSARFITATQTNASAYPAPSVYATTKVAPISPTPGKVQHRNLLNASSTEIEQVALDMTDTFVTILDRKPTVVLIRDVTFADLPTLGFDNLTLDADAPLLLVIVKGNFDISTLPGTSTASRKSFIGCGMLVLIPWSLVISNQREVHQCPAHNRSSLSRFQPSNKQSWKHSSAKPPAPNRLPCACELS